IDQSLWQRDQFGYGTRAASHRADPAIGRLGDAPIAGDLMHAPLAGCDMGYAARGWQGVRNGLASTIEAIVEEGDVDDVQSGVLLRDQLLRMQTDEGRIMLMDALDGHAIGCRPRRFGQRGA